MTGTDSSMREAPVPEPPAAGQRRAVIDIGTNSIKLLVAEVREGGVIRPVYEGSEQTRLGKGSYKTRRLRRDSIEATVKAVTGFAARARAEGVEDLRLIATSAMRDAQNAGELAQELRTGTGLEIEIISGEQEADWAFAGVRTNPALAGHPLLVLDVGGGSTEFIYGRSQQPEFRSSHALGTVRLMDDWELADPPSKEQLADCRGGILGFLRSQVFPALAPHLESGHAGGLRVTGTGGTPVILARIHLALDHYDREQIEAVRLTRAEVDELTQRLWSLPLAQRRDLTGLPPDRADVILAGSAIYSAIMEAGSFEHLHVSTRGLRFAAVAASR